MSPAHKGLYMKVLAHETPRRPRVLDTSPSRDITRDNGVGRVKSEGERVLTTEMHEQTARRVLVVADESRPTNVVAAMDDRYVVETVTTTAAALEALDDDVGVAVIDRRDATGRDRAVRSLRHGSENDVGIVVIGDTDPTREGVDSGLDVAIAPPDDPETVHAIVDRHFERRAYDTHLHEHYALATRRAMLEAAARTGARNPRASIDTIDEQLEALESRVASLIGSFGRDDFDAAFRGVARTSDD